MPNIQDDIIKELGIDQLPPEKQEEILTAMTEVILKRIILRVLENFDEAQKDEFEKVCSAGDQDQVNNYLMANVPDYENVIKDEIAKFKSEMHETVNTLLS